MTSVGEDMEKLEPIHAVGGMQNGAVTVINNMRFPQKIKNKATK